MDLKSILIKNRAKIIARLCSNEEAKITGADRYYGLCAKTYAIMMLEGQKFYVELFCEATLPDIPGLPDDGFSTEEVRMRECVKICRVLGGSGANIQYEGEVFPVTELQKGLRGKGKSLLEQQMMNLRETAMIPDEVVETATDLWSQRSPGQKSHILRGMTH